MNFTLNSILSITTGFLMPSKQYFINGDETQNMSEIHALMEFIINSPLFAPRLPQFVPIVKEAILNQHPILKNIKEWDRSESIEHYMLKHIRKYGAEFNLQPCSINTVVD
jgi:hypothetical protein